MSQINLNISRHFILLKIIDTTHVKEKNKLGIRSPQLPFQRLYSHFFNNTQKNFYAIKIFFFGCLRGPVLLLYPSLFSLRF